MLTPPDLAPDTILAALREAYALPAARATFLPLGADINTFVFRVEAGDAARDGGAAYFLKLRRGDFDAIVVDVPAFLHAHGIRQVMAPLATTSGGRWVRAHGYTWILYPFMAGVTGYEVALADDQWVALGACLRGVHTAALPPTLADRLPREEYSSRWRDAVRGYQRQVTSSGFTDPVAARMAALWTAQRHEIEAIVSRAERLAQALRGRANVLALCHGDLHPGNLLLAADGALAIVDWDQPILAPKEHDLMAVGAGFGFVRETPHEHALFYRGYGPAAVDPVALSYYRYERIVADLAAYGEQIFETRGGVEDREQGLAQLAAQFRPGNVVPVAHRTYERAPRMRS